jgi:acetate kinase
MSKQRQGLMTLNAGSSSIKFALYTAPALEQLIIGQIDGIGSNAAFKAKSSDQSINEKYEWPTDQAPQSHSAALKWLIEWLSQHIADMQIKAVGHRVVHGGQYYSEPVMIDDGVLKKFETLLSLAPLHEPHNIAGIKAARESFGNIPQVACFDTAFHRNKPFINDTFAIPRYFYEEGIRRYGFHGLSYEFISKKLSELYPEHANGRVIVLHLGNGASMAALKEGKSIASTMAFSALDGLPMGTRCGDIDPGVLLYLMDHKKMSAKEISDLLYKESGLKGLSGISNDMRTLESSDSPAAKEAIEYFISRVKREIGSLAMALGGLDAIVFTGGIGENSMHIRQEVLKGCEWLGVELDEAKNATGQTVISTEYSKVSCLRIPTDEEGMIAAHTLALSNLTII